MQQCFKTSLIKTLGFIISLAFISSAALADEAITTPSKLYFPTLNTVVGNPNGKITIVEFFDYNCGYCHQVPALFAKLLKSNPEVRIVYRDYPVLGEGSTLAARAAVAAAEQGKYVDLHNALFSTHKPFTDSTIVQLANSVGVDTSKLQKDIDSRPVSQQLRLTAQAANQLQLNGVPVVVVAATPTNKAQKSVNAYVLTAPSYAELTDAVNKLSSAG